MNHPIQPVEKDNNGRARFKSNAIVMHLLDKGPFDMHTLAELPFSREDREQFAQLIGYSVCGAFDLSYVSTEVCETADRMWTTGETEQQARITYLESELSALKEGIRLPMARLFGKHPDDLA